MIDNNAKEQELCRNCGFCCDHTLFDIAGIKADEILPEKFVGMECRKDDQRYFKLPCPYFDGVCTIYQEEKAHVCGSFRCKVLKDSTDGKISFSDALEIIKDIKNKRDSLLENYKTLTNDTVTFRELRWASNALQTDSNLEEKKKDLFHKVQLLDFHLSQHFRSKESFDNNFEILDDD